jgi:hypothetical protein
MNITNDQSIDWIIEHMPAESLAALRQFCERNAHFRGAGWDDVLEILLDADADLQWTEPLHEVDETFPANPLESAVTTTLAWAVEGFVERPAVEQIIVVRATIDNNSGAA